MTAARKPPSKKALISQAREIIDRNQIDVAFSALDLLELSSVTGTELRFAVRRVNPTFPNDTRHLHVLAYEWSQPQQWSWVKAIQMQGLDPAEEARRRQHLNEQRALRYAVAGEMRAFLSSVEPRRCRKCDTDVDLAADHAHPPFIQIANKFLETRRPLQLRQVPGAGDLIGDINVEADWIAFHAARATYQVLCRPCNSRKGARSAA